MHLIVTNQVAWSVGLSVAVVSPAKMVEPIKMLFGLRTWVGLRNHVLDGVQIPLWEGAILMGEGQPIVKYMDTLRELCKKWLNRWRCSLGFGVGWAQGSMYYCTLAPPVNFSSAVAMRPVVKLLRPLVMVTLWNRADHYIFILWFLLSSFFRRLVSAVRDWMSAILPHLVWP